MPGKGAGGANSSRGQALPGRWPLAEGDLASLREEAEHWRGEAEAARIEAAVAQAEGRLLREGLERERARADRLEAEPAEERRKPWWRRLLGG